MNKLTNVISRELLEQILQSVQDPHIGLDLSTLGALQRYELDEGQNQLNLYFKLGYPMLGYNAILKETILQAFNDYFRNNIPYFKPHIEVSIQSKIQSHVVQKGLKPIKGVKNTIAIASGKGGVGKSTTAINLALSLLAEGARVGILDADIYGPSQPKMLGLHQRPETQGNKKLLPVSVYGLQTMSMGYLIDEHSPMVWRGPMVSSALQQLGLDTEWDALDYLIIDLPPGTGDIQLTLAQKIPVSGALIVTTPQDIALMDAVRALNMFRKLEIPVLGVIENMSIHICSECGHHDPIFGSNGGLTMAKQYQIPLLGKLPLLRSVREQMDLGKPIVVAEPEGSVAHLYKEIARKAAAKLSLQEKQVTSIASSVIVEAH